MAKIRIDSSDRVFDAPEGEDLLEVLQSNGYPIATSCGGVASCGLCRLTIVRGAELLSPLKSQEVQHLGTVAKVLGLRLACQSRIVGEGEIVVRVPPVDDVEDRKRRKAERLRASMRRDVGPPSSRGEGTPRPVPRAKIEWRPRVLAATPGPPGAAPPPASSGPSASPAPPAPEASPASSASSPTAASDADDERKPG